MNLKMITSLVSLTYWRKSKEKVRLSIVYMFVSTNTYQYVDIVSLIFVSWFLLQKHFWLPLKYKTTKKKINNKNIKNKKLLASSTSYKKEKKRWNSIIKQFSYNNFINILGLFHVLPSFSFNTSETMRNYYL